MAVNKTKSIEIYKSIEGVEIKQCEGKAQSYKKHLHKELSIGLIETGSTVVDFNRKTFELAKGDLIIIPPMLSHRCSPDDINIWQFIMIYIDPKYYEGRLNFAQVSKVQGDIVIRFRKFIDQISNEADEIRTEELLIYLLDELEHAVNKDNLFRFQLEDEAQIVLIKQYIEEHYKDEISLHDLEKTFNINKFILIRKFKTIVNTTPSAYKLQLKIAEAKKQLEAGRDVFEICEEVGFYDQAHFIREFKRMNGMSPLNYLNNISKHRK